MSSPKEYRDKFQEGLKDDLLRLDAGMAEDVESAVDALTERTEFHRENFRRAGNNARNDLRNDLKKETVGQAPPPRALPAASKIKLDLFGVCALAVLAGTAVYAAYTALQHGLFGGSVWQLAGWLGVFAAVVIVGISSQGTHQTEIAHSKYATREDIDRYGIETIPLRPDAPLNPAKDQGIYLGTYQDPEHKWSPAELRYKGEKHLLCFGPTGSGKSASIMVPNLQDLPRSVIVTDPKGELAAITERHRRDLGDTIVLNPFGVLVKKRPHLKSVGWNPLAQLDPDSDNFPADAMCIADAIVESSAGNGNKFFDTYAKNLVQALVMWEVETGKEAANLRNIRTLMNMDSTFSSMRSSDNRVVREMGTDVYNRLTDKNGESTSIRDGMETLKNNLAFLNDARIEADMARGGAIDFAALHRTITTIYLILPPDQLKDQARWMRLFVNLALRKMYAAAPTDEARPTLPPVLISLDEFGNLGRLEEIVKALNMARYCRIQLMFFLQNIEQLTDAYQGEVGSFFSGAGASTTFKTGALDTKTGEHLAKAFGNQQMLVASKSRQGGSVKPEAIPLIRLEDIARLPPKTTISMIEPCPWPVMASSPIYADTRFKGGLDPNPYYHG